MTYERDCNVVIADINVRPLRISFITNHNSIKSNIIHCAAVELWDSLRSLLAVGSGSLKLLINSTPRPALGQCKKVKFKIQD